MFPVSIRLGSRGQPHATARGKRPVRFGPIRVRIPWSFPVSQVIPDLRLATRTALGLSLLAIASFMLQTRLAAGETASENPPTITTSSETREPNEDSNPPDDPGDLGDLGDLGELTPEELMLLTDPALFGDSPLDLDPTAPPKMDGLPSLWEHFVNFQLGIGYKDNIGLSHVSPDGSPFSLTGVDLMLFRLPIDGLQFDFFVLAEDRRYWDADLTDKEQTLISQIKARRIWQNGWSAGAGFQYVFQDQVFDASTTETDIGVIQIQVHTFSWIPEVRRETDSGWFVELKPKLSRVNFLAPLDDYWEGGPSVETGREFKNDSRLTLGYSYEHRAYDSRLQVDSSGVRIPGQPLGFNEHALTAEWRQYFDATRRWRSETKIEYELNRDNGSGYFDFSRYRLGQRFRYRRDPWMIQCGVKATRYDYRLQTASATDSSTRIRNELLVNARAEYELSKRWTLFAEYEFEQTFSNQSLDEYSVHSGMTGVNVEF